MRTDIKIGIAVGLFLAIVASVYFFVASGGDEQEPVVETPAPDPEALARVTVVDTGDTGSTSRDPEPDRTPEVETPAAVTPGLIEIRRVGEDPLDDPTPAADDKLPVGGDGDDALAVVGSDPTPTMEPLDNEDRAADVDTVITPVMPRPRPRALRADPIESDTTDLTVPADENFYSNVQRTYIVQHGDNGFWTVSARMYGNGKHFGVIAEANPNVDSNSLRPHQKLIVPPLPQKYRRKVEVIAPTSGVGFIGTEQTYAVQKGDAGFWGVSVKVFGHGKYYKAIAKANPGVNSATLRVGQKLHIPPKPADPSRPVAGDTGITTEDLPTGYRVYVVRRGDAGFWDVAVKMYGNGRHFGLVAQANPGVDSRRLQPNQKLRIPPLGEARRYTSAATAPYIEEGPGEIAPAGADPRPVFD